MATIPEAGPARTAETAALAVTALVAFAGNSLLCRAALRQTSIDPGSFTLIRIASGAVVLTILAAGRGRGSGTGSWWSAAALSVYAAAFSFAYAALSTATGALLLFGAVQLTMIAYGLFTGERLRIIGVVGLLLAIGGITGLLWPGLAAPPMRGALLMLSAGAAWGAYSLRGRGQGDALRVTAGNFARAMPLVVIGAALGWRELHVDLSGAVYAALSGAITSGIGYAIWYAVLPRLAITTAATLQLAVPVLASLAGALLLREPLTMRLVSASAAVLGGIAIVLRSRPGARVEAPSSGAR